MADLNRFRPRFAVNSEVPISLSLSYDSEVAHSGDAPPPTDSSFSSLRWGNSRQ